MVGGLGLPFRGFLQEPDLNLLLREVHLFFGCTVDIQIIIDYLYKEELEQFFEDGTLDQLHVAFSDK